MGILSQEAERKDQWTDGHQEETLGSGDLLRAGQPGRSGIPGVRSSLTYQHSCRNWAKWAEGRGGAQREAGWGRGLRGA